MVFTTLLWIASGIAWTLGSSSPSNCPEHVSVDGSPWLSNAIRSGLLMPRQYVIRCQRAVFLLDSENLIGTWFGSESSPIAPHVDVRSLQSSDWRLLADSIAEIAAQRSVDQEAPICFWQGADASIEIRMRRGGQPDVVDSVVYRIGEEVLIDDIVNDQVTLVPRAQLADESLNQALYPLLVGGVAETHYRETRWEDMVGLSDECDGWRIYRNDELYQVILVDPALRLPLLVAKAVRNRIVAACVIDWQRAGPAGVDDRCVPRGVYRIHVKENGRLRIDVVAIHTLTPFGVLDVDRQTQTLASRPLFDTRAGIPEPAASSGRGPILLGRFGHGSPHISSALENLIFSRQLNGVVSEIEAPSRVSLDSLVVQGTLDTKWIFRGTLIGILGVFGGLLIWATFERKRKLTWVLILTCATGGVLLNRLGVFELSGRGRLAPAARQGQGPTMMREPEDSRLEQEFRSAPLTLAYADDAGMAVVPMGNSNHGLSGWKAIQISPEDAASLVLAADQESIEVWTSLGPRPGRSGWHTFELLRPDAGSGTSQLCATVKVYH